MKFARIPSPANVASEGTPAQPLGLRFSRLVVQMVATVVVLGWVPGNLAKLAILVWVWMVGFGRVSGTELALMGGVNVLFVAMDYGAVTKGTFQFDSPDFLGLPFYEFLMWGFYTLHTIRLIGGRPPGGRQGLAIGAAVAFAIPFLTISDPEQLTITAGLVLALALAIFHEPLDFCYVGYMIALGTVIEHVGVGTGQWHYPGSPTGGVPLWSGVMWGGVGLFMRRLVQPIGGPGQSAGVG